MDAIALVDLTRLAGWIATYAIHSTLLLLLAAVLTGTVVRSARAREQLWRTALFGGLITAALQVAFGSPVFRASLPVPTPDVAQPTVGARAIPIASPHEADFDAGSSLQGDGIRPGSVAAVPVERGASPSPWWLLLLWPLGLAVLLARRGGARRRLAGWLKQRHEIEDDALLGMLGRLEHEAGLHEPVRLTSASPLSSPVALGMRSPEICLPTRALTELTRAEQEAMLAHEIAHLVRRDPAWLRRYRLVTALFFFQPLNHLAVRRLHDQAEILCDGWAARREDRRVALARCLARVATWILERPMSVPAPTMARRVSLLGVRVRRLLQTPPPVREATRGTRRLAALLPVVPVLLVAALAPGVHGTLPAADAAVLPATAPPTSAGDVPEPFRVLEAELGALEREATELQGLLAEAGHTDLARRIASRLEVLGARRDDLRRRIRLNGEGR